MAQGQRPFKEREIGHKPEIGVASENKWPAPVLALGRGRFTIRLILETHPRENR